jgi:hypothetical protein
MFFASFFYGLFGGGWGGVDERGIHAFVGMARGGEK